MKAKYLLDTNVLSEPLKPLPSASVLEAIDHHAEQIVTASMVWHELVFGTASLPKGKQRSAAERYLSNVVGPNIPVLAYEVGAATWHAQERARLKAIGRTPPFTDGQIASIAAVNGLTLVTANTRDFAAFRDLQVICWHD